MRPYQYRCNDHSLLTPIFKRVIVTPFIKLIPWSIPANIITLISNLFVYFALYLSIYPLSDPFNKIVIGLCFLLYLIGDHLDGMQAKRTGTGSALGEFCDHYLDAFNNGIVLYTLFKVFGLTNPILIATVITASYLAHVSIFYEQFKTGWLTFEKLGSLEAVLLASALVLFATFQPINAFLQTQLWKSVTVFELVMIASVPGSIVTFVKTTWRTPSITGSYWIFIVSLLLVTGLGITDFNHFQVFVLITLYASLYVGRCMQGHLLDGRERTPDYLAPSFLILNTVFEFLNTHNSFTLLILYLLVMILSLIIQSFSSLKMYWVWRNPRPNSLQ